MSLLPLYQVAWPGLRSFSFANRKAFLGRDPEVRSFLNRALFLSRVVCFHARSGTGKSSFLEAGVFPKLLQLYEASPARTPLPLILKSWTPPDNTNAVARVFAHALAEGLSQMQTWGVHEVSPRAENAFILVQEALSRGLTEMPPNGLSPASVALAETLRMAFSSLTRSGSPAPVILFLDQFEEFMGSQLLGGGICESEDSQTAHERAAIRLVLDLLRACPWISVVFSLRSEYLGVLAAHIRGMGDGLNDAHVELKQLERCEVERLISQDRGIPRFTEESASRICALWPVEQGPSTIPLVELQLVVQYLLRKIPDAPVSVVEAGNTAEATDVCRKSAVVSSGTSPSLLLQNARSFPHLDVCRILDNHDNSRARLLSCAIDTMLTDLFSARSLRRCQSAGEMAFRGTLAARMIPLLCGPMLFKTTRTRVQLIACSVKGELDVLHAHFGASLSEIEAEELVLAGLCSLDVAQRGSQPSEVTGAVNGNTAAIWSRELCPAYDIRSSFALTGPRKCRTAGDVIHLLLEAADETIRSLSCVAVAASGRVQKDSGESQIDTPVALPIIKAFPYGVTGGGAAYQLVHDRLAPPLREWASATAESFLSIVAAPVAKYGGRMGGGESAKDCDGLVAVDCAGHVGGLTWRGGYVFNRRFTGLRFVGCDLRGTVFTDCVFDGCLFKACDLRGVIVRSTEGANNGATNANVWHEVVLDQCLCSAMLFIDTRWHGVTFDSCLLDSVTLRSVKCELGCMRLPVFRHAAVRSAGMSFTDLSGLELDLGKAHLAGTAIWRVDKQGKPVLPANYPAEERQQLDRITELLRAPESTHNGPQPDGPSAKLSNRAGCPPPRLPWPAPDPELPISCFEDLLDPEKFHALRERALS